MVTLLKSIDDTETTIMFSEYVGFPATPATVNIGTENISYTSNVNGTLYGCTRGAHSTTPAAHTAGAEITLVDFYAAASAGGTTPVSGGGTGKTSFTAYAVVAGGTTSTGALQSVSGVGTSGQVLTSNGAAALPTWQDGGSTYRAPVTGSGASVALSNTNEYNDVASILVPAGTWCLFGTFFSSRSAGGGQANYALSAFSGNTTTDQVLGQNLIAVVSGDTGAHSTGAVAGWVVTPVVDTTYYLKILPNGGTASGWGTITALPA